MFAPAELKLYKRFLQPIYRRTSNQPPPQSVRKAILRFFVHKWLLFCNKKVTFLKTFREKKRSSLWIQPKETPSIHKTKDYTLVNVNNHSFYVQYV
jgi:hypothetical protein